MKAVYIGAVYGTDGCWPVYRYEDATVAIRSDSELATYADLNALKEALDPGYSFYPKEKLHA